MEIDKTRLYYGSFEDVLLSHIKSPMPHIKLARTLILAPWDEVPEELSDKIDDAFTSKLRSGKVGLTKKMLEPYKTQMAHEKVLKCIEEEILTQVHVSEYDKLQEEVLDLIRADSTLSTEIKSDLEEVARAENLEFFLTDVYLLAAKCSVAQKSAKKKTAPRQKQEAVSKAKTADATPNPPRTPDPVTPFWGDSDGCRPSFSRQQVEDGILGNKIVFNSIYDSVIGNEKNFLGIREDIKDQAEEEEYFNSNYITVEHGKTYIVRVYVHNNSPLGLEAVAKDVRVAINVPEVYAKQHHITGVIESSNATPRQYWAGVVVRSDSGAFRLEYVYGSARLENNGIGKFPSIKISDDIVTRASSGGVLLAYDSLDGSIPGCYQYANYVVIRVRALFDIGCFFEKRVRLAGDKHWYSDIHVNVGDEVEFQIQYKNTDRAGEVQNNVIVRDIAMKNLRYKAGSAKLYNGHFPIPDGHILDDAVISQAGTNIGHYAKNGNAFVRFTAVAVDEDLKPGANTLTSWAEARIDQKIIQDYATVVIYKTE